MKTENAIILLIASLFALGGNIACAGETITKSFQVKPGGKLLMNVDRGSIHVTTSDSDKVDVRVEREMSGASESKTKEILEQHKIDISASDNEVSVQAQHPRSRGWGRNPFTNLRVEYTIAIPSKFNVDLKTAGGHIELGDLEGKADLNTAGGNIKMGSIKGDTKAHTSGGHVSLAASRGNVDLHTSGGDMHIGRIEGDLLARTSGGHIEIEKIKGSARAETSGGNVRIKEAYGPITAHTSGGNVSAQLNEQPKRACSLQTSGGNVEVQLAENLALALNARTSGGSIHSDFPGTLNKQKTKLTAELNGGGPDLLLETSGGNVNIRKK